MTPVAKKAERGPIVKTDWVVEWYGVNCRNTLIAPDEQALAGIEKDMKKRDRRYRVFKRQWRAM